MGEGNGQLNPSKGKSSGNVLVVFFRISIHRQGGGGSVDYIHYIFEEILVAYGVDET